MGLCAPQLSAPDNSYRCQVPFSSSRAPPPAPAVPEGKGAGGGTSGGRQAHGRPKKEKLQARGGCSEPGWKPPTAFIHLEMK